MFDEHFQGLQGQGEKRDLKQWYAPGTNLTQILFRNGPFEELVILDDTRVRAYSLLTRQLR